MYNIVYIKPSKTEGYLTLGIDALGERIRVSIKEDELSALGIRSAPYTLTQEEYEEIRTVTQGHEVLKAALSLLAYADNSRRQLYLKLRRRGFSDELARGAISECERLGYLNEERQIENLVHSLATVKLYGRERIVQALSAKGYSTASVRRVISRLCDAGDIDFDALRDALLEKHGFADTDSDLARALLYRHGYRT